MNNSDMNSVTEDNTSLYINTLGNFEIKYNGNSVFNENRRSYKIWELFNFLLTYRNENLTQEKIIDNLLEIGEYSDPQNVLKAQIFRLRNVLNEIDGGKLFKIKCRDGYYTFVMNPSCVLDVDVFEVLCREYDNCPFSCPEQKLPKYYDILSVYKGEYLSGLGYDEWVTPVRNYYHRMFLNCTYGMLKILKSQNMEEELVDICEKVIMVEPYDETVNAGLLQAYISMRKYREAEEYYRYVASKYYREFGTKPSKNIQQIYSKIKIKDNSKSLLADEESCSTENGPICCAPDIFRYIYRIERLRERDSTLCVITVQGVDLDYIPSDLLGEYMKDAKEILLQKLGKGDVFTIWNETQIYIVLSGSDEKAKNMYRAKLDKKLNEVCSNRSIVIKVHFEPV